MKKHVSLGEQRNSKIDLIKNMIEYVERMSDNDGLARELLEKVINSINDVQRNFICKCGHVMTDHVLFQYSWEGAFDDSCNGKIDNEISCPCTHFKSYK